MKKYEIIVILDPQKVDDGGEAFVKQFETAIGELGGQSVSSEKMGRKQFAAPIRKRTTGFYWSLVVTLPPAKVAALKERYHLDQNILRLRLFIYDKPAVTVIKRERKDPAGAPAMVADDADPEAQA